MKKTDKKKAVTQEAKAALALIAGVAATAREGLHELVVRSGLGVVAAMFERDRWSRPARASRRAARARAR